MCMGVGGGGAMYEIKISPKTNVFFFHARYFCFDSVRSALCAACRFIRWRKNQKFKRPVAAHTLGHLYAVNSKIRWHSSFVCRGRADQCLTTMISICGWFIHLLLVLACIACCFGIEPNFHYGVSREMAADHYRSPDKNHSQFSRLVDAGSRTVRCSSGQLISDSIGRVQRRK